MKNDFGKVFVFNFYECKTTDGGPGGVISQNLLGHQARNYYVNPVFWESVLLRDHVRKRFFPPDVPAFYHDWYIRCQKIYCAYQVRKYPVVFFHDVFSLACCLHLIPSRQTVMLQSHSPELPHEELLGIPSATQEMVIWARKAELLAFSRADHYVFPNEGVLEIYRPLLQQQNRILYLPTGAREVTNLQKFPLDPACIHFLYIGRRNMIKGFDIVLAAFRHMRQRYEKANLVVIGSGDKIEEEGIMDIGFSNCPHDWISSCDFVINCNRRSYFDLSVLETLSIGTPLIMSTNEGHAVFAPKECPGIISVGEASIDNLSKALDLNLLEKYRGDSCRAANRRFFQSSFTTGLYRSRLEELCANVLDLHHTRNGSHLL